MPPVLPMACEREDLRNRQLDYALATGRQGHPSRADAWHGGMAAFSLIAGNFSGSVSLVSSR